MKAERGFGSFVLALALAWAGLNGLWWWANRAPPAWDQTDYILRSLEFFSIWKGEGLRSLLDSFLNSTSGFGRPPLLSLLPLPLYGLFGTGWKVAHLVLLPFVFLLVLSVFGIGRRLGSREASLWACLAVATIPHLSGLSRQMFVEFPLASVVAATVYLLVRLRDEDGLGLYGALSILLASGLMLKVTYLVFVAPLIGWVAFGRWKEGRGLGGLALASALGLALACLWYLPNLKVVIWEIRESGYGLEARPYELGGPGRFLARLAVSGLSLYYGALLLVLLFWSGKRLARGDGVLLGLWIGLPLAVFASAVGRDPRYFAPSWPAFALLAGLWLDGARLSRKLKAFAFAFPVASLLFTSFVPARAFPEGFRPVVHRAYELLASSFQNPSLDRRDWRSAEVVEHIWRLSGGEASRVVLLANHPRFHVNLFNLEARLAGWPVSFSVCENTMLPFSEDRCLRLLLGAHYLLDKTGLRQVAGPDRYGPLLEGWLRDGCLPFRLLPWSPKLPDGSSVLLWQRDEKGPSDRVSCIKSESRLSSWSGRPWGLAA